MYDMKEGDGRGAMRKAGTLKKLIVMGVFAVIIGLSAGCSGEDDLLPMDAQTPSGDEEMEIRKEFRSTLDDFAITATDLWMEDVSIHEDSSLSLYNEEYNSYLIVLTDEKATFPEDIDLAYYSELVSRQTTEEFEEAQVTEPEAEEFNGVKGNKFYIKGLVDGVSVTYAYLIFENERNFYQVVLWSSTGNIENNLEYYEDILLSFEFL